MRRLFLAVTVIALIACTTPVLAAETRTWTDKSGKFTVSAEFVSYDGETVELLASNGKVVRVQASRLCKTDQEFLSRIHKTREGAANGLEGRIAEKRYAHEVVALLEAVNEEPASSKGDKQFATEELPRWRDLAGKRSIKYGGKWRTGDEVADVQKEAQSLIHQASSLISVSSNKFARESLLKASKIDPEGVQADFTLGLLHALVGGHPDQARERFLVCIRRLQEIGSYRTSVQTANLRAALNNAAIAEVRLKRDNSAIGRWREAVELGRLQPEVVQNLGRYSDLAAAGGFVVVPATTAKAIGTLYANTAGENTQRQYDASAGWLYIPFTGEIKSELSKEKDGDKPVNGGRAVPGTQDIRIVGTGSGFAVGPDLVVTNRHVAEGAQSLHLHSDQAELSGLRGEVLAHAVEEDLSLLRFPGLNVAPLKISQSLPRLSTAIRVLGFPESDLLGNALKVTGGDVAGLPNEKGGGEARVAKMLLLDATANPGNSGGPVIDIRGDVVGVLTLGVNLQQGYSAAVPSLALRKFLIEQRVIKQPNADDLFEAADRAEKDVWEDVVEQTSKSTFQILVFGESERPAWIDRKGKAEEDAPKQPANWNGLEDPWCMYCNGLSHIDCQARNCRGGVVVGRRRELYHLPTGVASKFVPTQNPCGNCNGTGRVSCPHCSNGFDPGIR